MISRRSVLATSAATAAAATVFNISGKHAKAASVDIKIDPYNQTDKQKAFHAARFETLEQESVMDFTEGFKRWNQTDMGGRDARRHYSKFLEARGLPSGQTDLPYEECYQILLEDPHFEAAIRFNRSSQALMWDRAMQAFHGQADKYLSLMEATDSSGPGSLELNPNMHLPDYTVHEIHAQPGGYVGDPFAGWVYHWALTQAFYQGRNQFDEAFLSTAQDCPKPADGEVKRILDVGTGAGLGAMAYKERFPNAEVWGIDVGGPMVRYGHYEAVQRGLDVHYAQRLAEDTKFPDNYFDIVSDYLVFHEVTHEAAKKIVPEIHRILRPGGIFYHDDSVTEGNPNIPVPQSVYDRAWLWVDHRHNIEPWIPEYRESDFPGIMRKAGFDVDLTLRKDVYRKRGIYGVKPV